MPLFEGEDSFYRFFVVILCLVLSQVCVLNYYLSCLVCAQYVVSRHRTLMNVYDKAPKVDKDAFVAPSASIIGNVNVGQASSIWYGCVLRGKQECKLYLHYSA